jgi:hypothetical protein
VNEKAAGDRQRTANSEATLIPLYRKFWKQKHNLKQYFISLEEFTRKFADYFFTFGLDDLTLDQLLELSDIYFPMDTTSMSISFVSDLHTTSAVSPNTSLTSRAAPTSSRAASVADSILERVVSKAVSIGTLGKSLMSATESVVIMNGKQG